MKVILLKELHGKGGEGDVIDVNRGYANSGLRCEGYPGQLEAAGGA